MNNFKNKINNKLNDYGFIRDNFLIIVLIIIFLVMYFLTNVSDMSKTIDMFLS